MWRQMSADTQQRLTFDSKDYFVKLCKKKKRKNQTNRQTNTALGCKKCHSGGAENAKTWSLRRLMITEWRQAWKGKKKTHQGTDKSWGETGESEKRRQMIQMRMDVKEPSDSDSPAYLKWSGGIKGRRRVGGVGWWSVGGALSPPHQCWSECSSSSSVTDRSWLTRPAGGFSEEVRRESAPPSLG